MGWQGYDNERCMPGDKERFLRLQEGMRRSTTSSPSYTLAEIKQLARESVEQSDITNDDKIIMRLVLSRFLAWLAKREQGKGSER